MYLKIPGIEAQGVDEAALQGGPHQRRLAQYSCFRLYDFQLLSTPQASIFEPM
jgi:hypothetical protein